MRAVLIEVAAVEVGWDRASEIGFSWNPFAGASSVEWTVEGGLLAHTVGVVHLAVTAVSFNQASLAIGIRGAWQ